MRPVGRYTTLSWPAWMLILSDVYQGLNPSQISRKNSMANTTVYKVLHRLEEDGLVKIQRNVGRSLGLELTERGATLGLLVLTARRFA